MDLNNYTVFSGPEDSYFGFSWWCPLVVVGAPTANTSQSGVSRGGSVFMCPWTSSEESCQTLNFDQKGVVRPKHHKDVTTMTCIWVRCDIRH
uniref:Uncharacterized protein n=1 Tax=Sinocyclocheilus anshuiensis TaxID=1608454 RepID=A0A671MNR0_9TELE